MPSPRKNTTFFGAATLELELELSALELATDEFVTEEFAVEETTALELASVELLELERLEIGVGFLESEPPHAVSATAIDVHNTSFFI